MNMTIHDCFELYSKNFKDWDELEKRIMKPNSKTEWFHDFYDAMGSFQSIYDTNKEIVRNVAALSSNLNDSLADELYNETFAMYLVEKNDPEFILFVCERLIAYYKDSNEHSKMVNLYTMVQNCLMTVGNPEGNGRQFDILSVEKCMEYISKYKELDDSARYRVWVSYYNYIVRLSDYGVVPIDDALDCYERLMAFSAQPDILSLDNENEGIKTIKEYLYRSIFTCIAYIGEASEATKLRFYKLAKDYFENNPVSVQSPYELTAQLFTSLLLIEYVEKKIDVNEVFKRFLDYITYQFRLITTKGEYDKATFIQIINTVRYITNLGKYLTDKELFNDAINQLLKLIQNNKIKSNLSDYEEMSEMMGRVCASLVSCNAVGIDKEKCISELVVKRDINVYIHSILCTEISMALYREMTGNDSDFFKDVKSVPASEWKSFLYYCSMFHDVGMEHTVGTVVYRGRPLLAAEKARHKKHILYGTYVMEFNEGTAKYASVIKGHHTYYNEDNTDEYKYDRSLTDLNPFTDILALSAYIEESTDYLWDFSKQSRRFDTVLNDIKALKNTRFNGELVDAILNNEALQKEIERLVSVVREDIVYDVYNNWEKIQLSQDENTMLEDCLNKYDEYRNTKDEDAFIPYLERLEYLAANSKYDSVKAKALYKIMMHRFVKGQYNEGFIIGREAEALLKKVKYNELLVEYYYNVGNAWLLIDNNDEALRNYLTSLYVAKKTPGCDEVINMTLLSIAGIFVSKRNYKRAKEYFDMCSVDTLRADEQIRYLCMQGYCYTRLDELQHIEPIMNKMTELMAEHEEYVIYPQFIYLAIFAAKLEMKDKLEEYLSTLKGIKLEAEDVTYYSDEMFLYIELLDKTGRYKEASDTVDQYIKLCENRNEYSLILTRLLNIKIEVVANIKGLSEIAQYEDKLRNAFYKTNAEEAIRIESLEKSLKEEIKLKAEHEEMLNNKALLEESVKKAKSDSEQKSQFLSSMSHEIRTPINAILGLNEMIMRESGEEQILQYASDIQNAGKQLLGIINDILDYSKIEAGKMEIVTQNYQVKTIVNDIRNMMELKFKEKKLEFIINVNEDMPNVLLGDDLRIKQILLNLLSNAYKYTKTGSVVFSVDYAKLDERNVNVTFSVKDTGMGLKKEQIDRIASPYERFDLHKNHSIEGTGLGMNIVTRLLDQMDSSLLIESEYGKGSIFSFTIKQEVVEWNRIGNTDATADTLSERKVSKGKLYAPNAKVLVVDDNAVNLKVAAALLKRTGVNVTSAQSGAECLKLCKDNTYNIILLDHMMPEMDGLETLKKLKEENVINETTPVVALTANVVESKDNFYIKAGFDALLTKPIDADKLETLMLSLLPEYLIESCND